MIFDKFKGMQSERKIKMRKASNLERLIEVGAGVIRDVPLELKIMTTKSIDDLPSELYSTIYRYVSPRLSRVDFNEDDLKYFVNYYATCQKKYDESIAIGVCSGILLSLLTKINAERNKKTTIYLNGKGNFNLNFLFSHARYVDELIVDNYKANRVCEGIGSRGYANLVICRNVSGWGFFRNAAGMLGSAGLLIGSGIKADLSYEFLCLNQGHIGMIIGKDIKGQRSLKIKRRGNEDIGLIAGVNVRGKNALSFRNGELVDETKEPDKFYQQMKKYKIWKMLDLVDSINEENYAAVAGKIRNIYRSIQNGL